jgi:serine/threonine protein kinase
MQRMEAHCNIVKYIGHDKLHTMMLLELCSYSIMDYVDNCVEEGNGVWRLTSANAEKWSLGILAALTYIHGMATPIIHRDSTLPSRMQSFLSKL